MIHGDKIILRALETDDAPLLHRWKNDQQVVHWLGQRLPVTLAETRAWVEEQVDKIRELRLGIADTDNKLIGWCDLARWDPLQDSAFLTVAIGQRDCWGGGYGTDATLTLCAYGFAELNLHRITLYVFADHAPAIHTYEKCGFVHEGRLRQSSFRHGKRQDLLVMGLLREEFKQKWPVRWERLVSP
ncbi:MAG: GNAT family N-acetyltransferase [Armatimonadota bacterium]